MKTPEKIKRWLEACIGGGCDSKRIQCPYRKENDCTTAVVMDALALIQQLEAELEKTRAQLAAALNDLKDADRYECEHCANYSELPEEKCDEAGGNCELCNEDCPCRTCVDNSNWQWRGERK